MVPAVLFALAAPLAGCSSGGSSATDGAGPTTTTVAGSTDTTTTDDGAPDVDPAPNEDAAEAFEGDLDDFYVPPADLGEGEPGQLLRTMAVDAPDGETGMRIMYRSTDAEGDERVVTGVAYWPTDDAPDDGWPILAWAHGTSGLAAPCAPSRGPSAPPAFGVEGVRVATDYIGLGPPGEIHPYLSAAAEGHAVIDGVAAVRSIPEAHAGTRWLVAGVSQGGHAALVTNEQAAERAADLDLVGAVALAPGSELASTYGDGIQIRIITTMVLVGVAAEDPSVDLADYLSPDALAASSVIETGCIGDIIGGDLVGAAAADDYFTVDPRTSPVGEAWLAENDPGQVVGAAPLLLVQGGQDILVVPPRTDALQQRLCGLGQVVDRLDVPTADHDTVVDQSIDDVTTWIAARFADEPPTDDC